MELCSPPKLTRLVNCFVQNGVDIQPSVCERIEETAPISVTGNVDEVNTEKLVSLPALAGEVAVAQKHQISELEKKREILDRLKGNVFQVRRKIDEVKAELAAASRKVYLTEDDVARKKTSCEQLEKEIEELIASKQTLEKQVEVEKDKLQRGRETYNQYHQKMAAHAQEVELFELSSPIYQEIKNQKEENAKMKEELEYLRRFGDRANLMALQAEIVYLKDKKESQEQSIISKQSELLKESERQTQLKMDIGTLHKRNKAQLTRLKRQLQEAVSRNRRWNDEACQLEQKIAQLRGRMEE